MTTPQFETGDRHGEPLVSIVVLAWNNLSLTQDCVASLRATTESPHELILVDNGSTPDAAAWAAANADVAVLHEQNLGFARGMNAGLAAARGEVVAFVNNDTVWPQGWDRPLLEHFEDPATGIVVPAVTAAGNPTSVRETPGDDVIVLDPFSALPSGVAYLLRTDVARGLGGFDERYRLAMSEDLDLLFTCWVNDLEVILDTRVLVEHELHASLDQLDEDHTELWRANLDAFLARWTTVTPADVEILPGTADELAARNCRHARAAATWLAHQDRIRTELDERHEARVARIRARCEERLEGLRSQVRDLRDQAQPSLLSRMAQRLRD